MKIENKLLLFFGIISIIAGLYLSYFNNSSILYSICGIIFGFWFFNGSLFSKKGYIYKKDYLYGLWSVFIALTILIIYTYIIRQYYLDTSFLFISIILYLFFILTPIIIHRKIMKYHIEIRPYQETLKLNPEDVTAWNNKGAIAANFKAYNESLEYFDNTLEIDSQDSAALHNKGVVLTKQQKKQKAIKYFKKASEIDPGFENAKREGKIILET